MGLFALRSRMRPAVKGCGLILRQPEAGDFEAWRGLREESAGFLGPWEPKWPGDDLTRAGFRRRLNHIRREAAQRSGVSWFVLRQKDNALLGGLAFSGIRYGAAMSCQLGYWMGERHAGQGHMSKAVRLALAQAFGPMGLQRVEAACIEGNARSIGLLERVGFRREGFMRSYLEINGERRDHLLFAITKGDFSSAPDKAAIAGRIVAPMLP